MAKHSCKNCKHYETCSKYCYLFKQDIIDTLSASHCKNYTEKRHLVTGKVKCYRCMYLNKYLWCYKKKRCFSYDEIHTEKKCISFSRYRIHKKRKELTKKQKRKDDKK